MVNINRFIPILFGISLTTCAVVEKPTYLIKESSFVTYQGGDSVSFTILDASSNEDSLGQYKINYLNKDELDPNANIANLLFEEIIENGNFTSPFLPHYFVQNAQGELIIKAVGNSGNVLWLANEGETETGQVLYPTDLSNDTSANSFNQKLLRCDENNQCLNAGQYKLISLNITGTEITETPYANFEAYVLDISTELTIFDAEQAGNSKSYLLSGKQWLYPPIGVVKFVYEVNNFSGNSTLIGTLSNTNISIDESLKKTP